MGGLVRNSGGLAAIGVAGLLVTGAPVANAAEAQAPDVRYAHSASGDLGALKVGIGSDSAITGIRAHLPLYTVSDLVAMGSGRAQHPI